MSAAKFLALADMLDGAARFAREIGQEGGLESDPNEFVTENEASKIAKVSIRVLRDARRAGHLAMFGSQRSRTIRRADLMAWIESRRAPVIRGVDDADIERRMRRIARARRGTR